ncbi:hypothetical protein pgond44_14953 [Psychroflexus gondwanensis ACAM 44]|uniref:Uncharacterized protein n=1 Tax=Psychroflexus gondwanensis ACAM 44 TaxID=1189619 RepID=N1WHS9_9FLAO|nr:hypothetical protein [Psychroflexus gondwanensis]EMY79831.1 hypothetical protein pgond44_14953 [Psychroflexus gondwanensis ACAM 44]
MQESKRLNFLKSFLKLYGVEKIELTNVKSESISGIAIYDETDPEERQDFIWHKTENEVPSLELNTLIEKIVQKKWHNGDKITKDITEIEFVEFDNETKNRMEFELFEINIKMVDNGEETDSYFVHY